MSNATGRPFSSALRAFISETRIGSITAQCWYTFAEQVIEVCLSEQTELVHSALRVLIKTKPEKHFSKPLSSDSNHKLLSQLQAINKNSNLTKELGQLLRQTFDIDPSFNQTSVKQQKNNTSSSDVIVIQDDQISPKKNGMKRRKTMACKDDEIEIHESLPSSSKRQKYDKQEVINRPMFGFQLLKTDGLTCDGDAYLGLEDVIHCGGSLAVVCNFQIDIEWFWNNAPAIETFQNILIVHGGSDEDEQTWKNFLKARAISNNVQFIRPELPSYGTMHSKLFLLFYPNLGCRVCIHSANLLEHDWIYKTQAAYMRDFPLLQNENLNHKQNSDFKIQLLRYMKHCTKEETFWEERITNEIERIDFSNAGVAIISSVPGKHSHDSINHFGHLRLRHVLSENVHKKRNGKDNRGNGKKIDSVICQFSSLGSIQEKWLLEEFRDSICAESHNPSQHHKKNNNSDIQLVYPTVEQVKNSNEGLQAGMSIPVRNRNLYRDHITKRLYKWDASLSNRQTAMPHMKSFLRYQYSPSDKSNVQVSWVMIGSFNLSVAAWGRLQTKGTKLNILSYEFGVVFAPELWTSPNFALPQAIVKYSVRDSVKDEYQIDAKLQLHAFDKHSSRTEAPDNDRDVLLPIPYHIPPHRHDRRDTPWTLEKLEELLKSFAGSQAS